ncbi:NADP-dependent malic enzyme [Salaquimonas pukyongi]|uniref:NADP-dependent malic enzyme n=1 Tax=Salaquimonas pukyongi TaxID=2712698 RepID=UPI00096BA2A8|nr:NADP-dependent malic enzyme [Salaquimonas pukyongi]
MSDIKKTKKQKPGGYKPASELEEAALHFHRYPHPGKLAIVPSKPLGNQRDLALAYSPGVAAPCLHIADDPAMVSDYTSRGNLVAVVSNGTAVLGLGNIGALASKPVMEGKAVLFKKFAGVDVFDIEVDETDVEKFCNVVAALEPTFGGINLEDIKAPQCFEIEKRLRERMNIPVFHDDQHGTAIIAAAAILNGLELAGKQLCDTKIVASGAGAASIACLNILVSMGANRDNIWVSDSAGVIYKGRKERMDPYKEAYAKETNARSLTDIMEGADVFLGLSSAGILKPEMLKEMAEKPMVMALANPTPEIMPEIAMAARPDAMICTGRSDYPNQVNNVLCFPFIFRGALDCGATTINEDMKLAAVHAIAELAKAEPADATAMPGGMTPKRFGIDYLIPSPFDQRLIMRIAPAVAEAAMKSGVATRPIKDLKAYQDELSQIVFRSGLIMKPIIEKARSQQKRVIYADGEDERVLRAAQVGIEEHAFAPILVGRPKVIEKRLAQFGLGLKPGKDFEIINPQSDPRYQDYVQEYMMLTGRRGTTPETARLLVRTNTTVIAALAVHRGDADAMICGLEGRFSRHLNYVRQIIGLEDGVTDVAALSLLLTQNKEMFLADTHVREEPSEDEIVATTQLACRAMQRFGIRPKAALLSFSDFGSRDTPSTLKMRKAAERLHELDPELEVDGEMHGDTALSRLIRDRVMPMSRLKGHANLLIFPNLDAANITLSVAKQMADGLQVGPILLGTAKAAHVLTPAVTSRGVFNISAIAAVDAIHHQEG